MSAERAVEAIARVVAGDGGRNAFVHAVGWRRIAERASATVTSFLR